MFGLGARLSSAHRHDSPRYMDEGIKEPCIGGVTVPIFNVPKTVVDLFRYRQSASKRYKNSPASISLSRDCARPLRQRKRAQPRSLSTPRRQNVENRRAVPSSDDLKGAKCWPRRSDLLGRSNYRTEAPLISRLIRRPVAWAFERPLHC
jgi:hypothetical protein